MFFLVLLSVVIFTPIKEAEPLVHFQQEVRQQVDLLINHDSDGSDNSLAIPKKQEFAINNIQMNMSKKQVESKIGTQKRITSNEYGTKWYTYYNDDYSNFMMVSYIKNRVNAMYTNQNLISSKSKIKYATPKNVVRKRLGDPIQYIDKGRYRFGVKNNEYDVFHKDHIYTTVFYDKHEQNGVTSLLQVSENMENRLRGQYGRPTKSLGKSFEEQDFDLVNSERKQRGLNTLKYSSEISNTARKHSEDMSQNNYFDHTDLKGRSPFDRMKEDNIEFNAAGENLAYGQVNSIYAHEGLMNSLGHRKNILNTHYQNLGVGVDYNKENQPFWTENFTG